MQKGSSPPRRRSPRQSKTRQNRFCENAGQGHNTALPPFPVTCAAVSAFGLGAAGAFEPRAEKLNRSPEQGEHLRAKTGIGG